MDDPAMECERQFRAVLACFRVIVLAMETSRETGDVPITGLQKSLAVCNASRNNGYELSLSTGTARYDPAHPCSPDELTSQADTRMYEQKRRTYRLHVTRSNVWDVDGAE